MGKLGWFMSDRNHNIPTTWRWARWDGERGKIVQLSWAECRICYSTRGETGKIVQRSWAEAAAIRLQSWNSPPPQEKEKCNFKMCDAILWKWRNVGYLGKVECELLWVATCRMARGKKVISRCDAPFIWKGIRWRLLSSSPMKHLLAMVHSSHWTMFLKHHKRILFTKCLKCCCFYIRYKLMFMYSSLLLLLFFFSVSILLNIVISPDIILNG